MDGTIEVKFGRRKKITKYEINNVGHKLLIVKTIEIKAEKRSEWKIAANLSEGLRSRRIRKSLEL